MRTDTDLSEGIQMVGGISKIPTSELGQIDHILDIALDGLRYRAPSAWRHPGSSLEERFVRRLELSREAFGLPFQGNRRYVLRL